MGSGIKALMVVPLLILLIVPFASAHIPELVLEDRDYIAEPILVTEPEISYAYYGKLQGSPQAYLIESDKPFLLYVSLLVPYVGQAETSNAEFHIMKGGEKIVMMHDYQNWTRWYEEYGGDWYLQGPEYEAEVGPGTYVIEVHSDTNTEDYTLAIGKTEKFGPGEIFSTVIVLPLMKALFWGNYTLLAAYMLVIAAIVLAAAYFLLIRNRRMRKRKK